MKTLVWTLLAAFALAAPGASEPAAAHVQASRERWTAEQANRWYDRQPWLTGANYIPATAINQLEMWQAETWDPRTIDRELGWARQFGMNTMRVYLHDLAYEQDPEGFKRRLGEFLAIAARHGIRPMLVLFDSCWDPDPVIGAQHRPIPGVHNSGWLQSPGRRDLIDREQDAGFRRYVEDVVGSFARDERILAWDMWNEPDNHGGGSYEADQLAQEQERIEYLMPRVFAWARSRNPVQPLTSGLWIGEDWSPRSPSLTDLHRIQLRESDIITFHDYNWPESFERRIAQLRGYGRPIICTEWLARSNGSTVDAVLPIARRENVGMINWGFVQGDIQTHLPWDSWQRPYTLQQPSVWFHDLLRPDGTPYRAREAEIFRALRAQPAPR
ncbi:MAG TPA: 1,4-beta-xylanase [Allosphingosinicella sp.]|nr:1,4-beta-xylanase [Allosphingosinicella sp.]